MRLLYFTPLSIGILISISGCQLHERGLYLPPPKAKPKPQPKTTDYEFPLLKLKASSLPPKTKSDTDKVEIVQKVEQQPIVNSLPKPKEKSKIQKRIKENKIVTKEKVSANPFDSLITQVTGIFKNTDKSEKPKTNRIKTTKIKKSERNITQPNKQREKIRPRRRKSGQPNKLIFNKNTSLKEIPIPLPKLSSLKLNSLSQSIPTIPVSKIPILNTLLPEGSKVAHNRIKHSRTNLFQSPTSTSNKKSSIPTTRGNLDMANIRIGKSHDYTTLIFDSYQWTGYNQESTEESNISGKYEFSYEAENSRIVALIQGYNAFSALLGNQKELFKESDIVNNIYIDRYVDEDSIRFIIELRKKVKMNVIDVQNPGRIILNLYPQ